MSETNAWEKPDTSEESIITGKTTSKKSDGDKQGYVGSIETGAIGVTAKAPKKKPAASRKSPAKKSETTAIYSSKNVVWQGVGKLEKGYNIVTDKQAEQWLTRGHVRLATPEEVAREYGK